MKVLVAVQGSEEESFFRRAVALAALDQVEEVIVVHVIDSGPRGGLELGRERYLGRRPISSGRDQELARAEEDRARAGLGFARQALQAAGIEEGRLREVMLRGKPNETLRDLAEREGVGLTIIRGRPGKPGPHSLGKTARFLVDHAPGAALLVRP